MRLSCLRYVAVLVGVCVCDGVLVSVLDAVCNCLR